MKAVHDRRGTWLAAALLIAIVTGAGAAGAAEAPTRDEYVSRLEKVCKPDAQATQRAMKGAREDVRRDRLDRAAEKFGKATQIFAGTLKQISPAPRPTADKARLKKWFTYLNRQETYLRQITEQLREGHAIKAQRLSTRFIHNGNLANNVVLAFGFNYCSFEFSRYG